MKFISRKFYFLTDCFNQQIDHFDVYKNIVKKYITEKGKIAKYLNDVQNIIKQEYDINIPSKVLSNILYDLKNEFPDYIFYEPKRNIPFLKVKNVPQTIIGEYDHFSEEYENDSRFILQEFNKYLINNQYKDIKLSEFENILTSIEDNFLIKNINLQNTTNKVIHMFLEWVGHIFKDEAKNNNVIEILNKMLVPVLIYTYFSDENNPEDLAKPVVLDTNIIIYYLGANGNMRKTYVEEFFSFAKENNITFEITKSTVDQIRSLFKEPDRYDNPELAAYCKANPQLQAQLMSDAEIYLNRLFSSKGLSVKFPGIDYSEDENFKEEYDKLCQGLENAKRKKGKYISEYSIIHDINIIVYTKAVRNYSNYSQLSRLFLTNDFYLLSWVERINKKNFDSEITPLITLDKYTLLLWVAGKNTSNKKFVGKTWAYVADSFSYFKNLTLNEVLRRYNEVENNSPLLVDSYISPYVLLSKISEDSCSEYLAEKYLPDDKLTEVLTKFSGKIQTILEENKEVAEKEHTKSEQYETKYAEAKEKIKELEDQVTQKTIENIDLRESKKIADEVSNDIIWIIFNRIRIIFNTIIFWKK